MSHTIDAFLLDMLNKSLDYLEISERVNTWIVEREWSKQELANEAKCDRSTIHNIIKGQKVDLETLVGIAQAFKIDLTELLYGEVDHYSDGEKAQLKIELTQSYEYIMRHFSTDEKKLLKVIINLFISSNKRSREAVEFKRELQNLFNK